MSYVQQPPTLAAMFQRHLAAYCPNLTEDDRASVQRVWYAGAADVLGTLLALNPKGGVLRVPDSPGPQVLEASEAEVVERELDRLLATGALDRMAAPAESDPVRAAP